MKPTICNKCKLIDERLSLQVKREICYSCRKIYKYDIMKELHVAYDTIRKLKFQAEYGDLLDSLHNPVESKPFVRGVRVFKDKHSVHTVLYMRYVEKSKIADIIKRTGYSAGKVNDILNFGFKNESSNAFLLSVYEELHDKYPEIPLPNVNKLDPLT